MYFWAAADKFYLMRRKQPEFRLQSNGLQGYSCDARTLITG